MRWRMFSFEGSRRATTVGIIGRNGAGKIHPVEDPFAGRRGPMPAAVRIRGRVQACWSRHRFPPWTHRTRNVYSIGAILGTDKARDSGASFDEIVGFSEIDAFIDTPVKRYSLRHVRQTCVCRRSPPGAGNPDCETRCLAVGDYEFQRRCFGQDARRAIGRAARFLFSSATT